MLGREVATLVNEVKQPGSYEVTWDASGFASGVYFYRLSAGEFVQARRLVLPQRCNVTLRVFNSLEQHVATLVDQEQGPSRHAGYAPESLCGLAGSF